MAEDRGQREEKARNSPGAEAVRSIGAEASPDREAADHKYIQTIKTNTAKAADTQETKAAST
jgi:hypothetical protein